MQLRRDAVRWYRLKAGCWSNAMVKEKGGLWGQQRCPIQLLFFLFLNKNVYSSFITIAKNSKQPKSPPTGEWVNKWSHIHPRKSSQGQERMDHWYRQPWAKPIYGCGSEQWLSLVGNEEYLQKSLRISRMKEMAHILIRVGLHGFMHSSKLTALCPDQHGSAVRALAHILEGRGFDS